MTMAAVQDRLRFYRYIYTPTNLTKADNIICHAFMYAYQNSSDCFPLLSCPKYMKHERVGFICCSSYTITKQNGVTQNVPEKKPHCVLLNVVSTTRKRNAFFSYIHLAASLLTLPFLRFDCVGGLEGKVV